MATSAAELLSPSAADRPVLAGRSDSLSSNGSSLFRRPRIRNRTRTLPEGDCRSDSPGGQPGAVENSRLGSRDVATGHRTPPQGAGDQVVAGPLQLAPPRPPRSPRRSGIFEGGNGEPETSAAVLRERKSSATTSSRSQASNRDMAAASLQELLDLKNVCYVVSRPSAYF